MAGIPGPLSPEAIAAGETYYSGGYTPAPTASTYASDPASYYGPPPAPPVAAPAPPPPEMTLAMPSALPPEDPTAMVSPMGSQPPAPMSTMPTQSTRPEPSFTRDAPPGGPVIGPPVARQGYATSEYAKTHPKAGGGAGNPDPFGVKARTGEWLGTFDTEKNAIRRVAVAEGDRADMMSGEEKMLAQRRADDAVIMQTERDEAEKHFAERMTEQQRQLDELREKKIDPDRLMREDGMAFKAIIGGMFGGLYMGINKLSSNPFIDQLNKQIDRDINAQEKNIANERAAVGERMGMLREQRATFRDNETAKLQTRNMYYEAVKQNIAAEAAKYDQPILQARADQAINAVDRQQKEIQKALAERNQAQAAAAAAATIAARKAAEKELWEREKWLMEFGQKDREIDVKNAGKADEIPARFVATGKDENGQPTGYLDRTPADAGKAEEQRRSREEVRAEINAALKIRSDEGLIGRTLNRRDPKDAIQLYTPEWQSKMEQTQARLMSSLNQAAHNGTIDAGSLPLLQAQIGDLTARGGDPDVKLRGILESLDRAEEQAKNVSAGQTGTMRIVNGKQVFVPSGAQNAPNSPRSVPRKPVE